MGSTTQEFNHTGVTEVTHTIQRARNLLRFHGSETEADAGRRGHHRALAGGVNT